MKYLLDTCVISELIKPASNQKVSKWLNQIPSDALFLSVTTIGEIRKGLTKLPNSKKRDGLVIWFNTIIDDYKDRIIPIDLSVSETWGIILGNAEKKGKPMPSIDGLIAASAREHNLILVTKNERDYLEAQIPVINPWNL